MRILILGGDGYLGWSTAMRFASRGHEVWTVDNYLRRTMALETSSEPLMVNPDLDQRANLFEQATGYNIRVLIGDLTERAVMDRAFATARPEVVVHYAEQPSAPFSMMGREAAHRTLRNNLDVTFNCIWSALEHAPDCHIVKLGTMGEYGTPNIDIEEGWLEIEHKGRKDKFLFPRAASTLYHTSKVLDTDLLWFYVRLYGMRVSDLMQGPVYGISTDESALDQRLLPNFHYDDIFGTVVNRFLVQAVAGMPLTVYGRGGQTRGYLNLNDTLQCVELAAANPPESGELRVLNQLTETFSVSDIAAKISAVGNAMGLEVKIESIANPRREQEEHYYNPTFSGLIDLGLKPHFMTDEVIAGMLETVLAHKAQIEVGKIMPRVRWSS